MDDPSGDAAILECNAAVVVADPQERLSSFWTRRLLQVLCISSPRTKFKLFLFLCGHLHLQFHGCTVVSICVMLLSALALLARVWRTDCSQILRVDNEETAQRRNVQTCCQLRVV